MFERSLCNLDTTVSAFSKHIVHILSKTADVVWCACPSTWKSRQMCACQGIPLHTFPILLWVSRKLISKLLKCTNVQYGIISHCGHTGKRQIIQTQAQRHLPQAQSSTQSRTLFYPVLLEGRAHFFSIIYSTWFHIKGSSSFHIYLKLYLVLTLQSKDIKGWVYMIKCPTIHNGVICRYSLG